MGGSFLLAVNPAIVGPSHHVREEDMGKVTLGALACHLLGALSLLLDGDSPLTERGRGLGEEDFVEKAADRHGQVCNLTQMEPCTECNEPTSGGRCKGATTAGVWPEMAAAYPPCAHFWMFKCKGSKLCDNCVDKGCFTCRQEWRRTYMGYMHCVIAKENELAVSRMEELLRVRQSAPLGYGI